MGLPTEVRLSGFSGGSFRQKSLDTRGSELSIDPTGGNVILLVGYKQLNGKLYFIFRNSWGATWGDQGYGYISADYLREPLRHPAFIIQSQSKVSLNANVSCPTGQAPSTDGTCRGLCPDFSLKDATGNCPPPPNCPTGQSWTRPIPVCLPARRGPKPAALVPRP